MRISSGENTTSRASATRVLIGPRSLLCDQPNAVACGGRRRVDPSATCVPDIERTMTVDNHHRSCRATSWDNSFCARCPLSRHQGAATCVASGSVQLNSLSSRGVPFNCAYTGFLNGNSPAVKWFQAGGTKLDCTLLGFEELRQIFVRDTRRRTSFRVDRFDFRAVSWCDPMKPFLPRLAQLKEQIRLHITLPRAVRCVGRQEKKPLPAKPQVCLPTREAYHRY